MQQILRVILNILTKQVLRRYKPVVIGVTGSVGKTTARDCLYILLGGRFFVRKNEKNFNNQFGVPMTVLGIKPPQNWQDKIRMPIQILKAAWLAFGFRQKYPDVLVLEMGADRPGDIAYLARLVRPTIGVVTAVGEVPVHVEYYASPQEVAKEKAELIKALSVDGLAVLNYDDQTVLDMAEVSRATVTTFGFAPQANISFQNVGYIAEKQHIGGLSFEVCEGAARFKAHISKAIGVQQLYGVMAGVVVARHLGISLIDILERFEHLEFPAGRMSLIEGIHGSTIIDDTYNASPLAMQAALEALKAFARARQEIVTGGRRIAILADMKELGRYAVEAHQQAGRRAAQSADILITVGQLAKAMAEAARETMDPNSIVSCANALEAAEIAKKLVKEHDIVLVKGSQSMRMEKVVKALMAHPEQAKDLLVRQTGEWQ